MKSDYKKMLILVYINKNKNTKLIELEYLLGYSYKQVDWVLKKLEKNNDIIYNGAVTNLKLTEQGKNYLKIKNLFKVSYNDVISQI